MTGTPGIYLYRAVSAYRSGDANSMCIYLVAVCVAPRLDCTGARLAGIHEEILLSNL